MNDRAVALQERINRIAADLSTSTGKPLRFWLEETARMIAGTRRWTITEAEHGPRLDIDPEDASDVEQPPTSTGGASST